MSLAPFFAAGISPFVWARLYSHTDRRQIFATMGGPSAAQPPAPGTVPKDGAMLLRVSTLPLAPNHPSALRGAENCALALATRDAVRLSEACFAFYGAVWHPKTPTWLRVATRPMITPDRADFYATTMAETKPGSVPVLLECVATLDPPQTRKGA